ncbi:hypothetical protein APS_1518 [Acetobacter pasteurianus subsp. pasteurianus LMG 1262 = NBRC 106471]|nr:hypothetical protein APS_1518 [Acetobacter pasteurianus subsp. pasteurianus LMG 1262 = NBRC 106471]
MLFVGISYTPACNALYGGFAGRIYRGLPRLQAASHVKVIWVITPQSG